MKIMKKLLWVFIFIISAGFTYSQDLLEKTKAQAKIVVSKRIAPRNFSEAVGTTPTLGYNKWWYSASKADPSYFCYFNNKGIFFLECVMTKDLSFLKLAIEYYNTQSNYNVYGNDNPEMIKTHQFLEGKISIEITSKKNKLGDIFCLWAFKSKHKQEIIDFFKKYYE